ncbi:TPR repeat-containing thioredoxin TTL1-like [Canna indica]|uniref:TPR repeat-containing thioredoxin TTL1-like n=1 Tax=Canna indica TaxID=4628 RepID=A0AAQ3K4E4_9LILI|nr:TPR repeat-containing thioredoxin TTL1-like [Canna indica]
MSRSGSELSWPEQKKGSEVARLGRLEPVADRFRAAVSLTEDKPDFPELGSPVSPLRPAAATHTSSSSSSSGSAAVRKPCATDPGRRSHSGELSEETSPTAGDGRDLKGAHRRSCSGSSLIFSGGGGSSTASSPVSNVLPAGNICPSGKIGKTGMAQKQSPKSHVLGSGSGNYGHGSIMWGRMSGGSAARSGDDAGLGNSTTRRLMGRTDPQEVTRAGNEHYKRRQYTEALVFYDRAVAMCPENAGCRSNRAAALVGLGRLQEAARECGEALRLDPVNERAHHRLAGLYLRLGMVEDAQKHLFSTGHLQVDPQVVQKLQAVERHLVKCGDARKIGDWKGTLREADAAIATGADSSPLFIALRAEALLHLNQIDEADTILLKSCKHEEPFLFSSSTKIFGVLYCSYIHIVRAQVDMALGRFETAVIAAEKAKQLDARNIEVTTVLDNVRSVATARAQGNELFKSGNFAEACTAYGEGLKYNPSNPVLLCNRAACRSKLGQWEKSVEDCNEALKIQPNYTKALLRRADSYSKLERWAESVRDYEVLRKELPGDTEVAEALFRAQVALKTSRGEEISNLKFGGDVEEVTTLEQLHAAVGLPGASVIYFMTALNPQCTQMSPFVDALCTRYPSANFLKIDINQSPVVAKAENVRIVPTFKIYKNGTRVKEMICPSQHVLEYSVRHYSL